MFTESSLETYKSAHDLGVKEKRKEKEKTTPFGVKLMRSQLLYWAAQGPKSETIMQARLNTQDDDHTMHGRQQGCPVEDTARLI